MYFTLSSGSPSFLQSSAVSRKRSSFLPVNANLAPQRESSTAHAHPMPLLAPENTIHLWSTSQRLCTRCTLCFNSVCYRSVMPIFFKVTSSLKRKGRQDDRTGPCITTATWHCCKNFGQWERSFHWKLRCLWLKFLRQRQVAVVQSPGDMEGKLQRPQWRPGARPTKHISIEFEIWWKFKTL